MNIRAEHSCAAHVSFILEARGSFDVQETFDVQEISNMDKLTRLAIAAVELNKSRNVFTDET